MCIKKSLRFCFVILYLFTFYQGYCSHWIKKEDKKYIGHIVSDYTNPVLWAKPLEYRTLKILAIAPRYSSLDFNELEKRLDCSIKLITTEDSSHLGCDPLWGIWCSEEFKSDSIIKKIKTNIEGKWDLIIIAGIELDILPKEIYEKIIGEIAKGTGLCIIPANSRNLSPPHPIEDFINSLEFNSEPTERWKNLFSGSNKDIKEKILNNISCLCTNYERGKIVYIKNYLDGVLNHALLPEKAVIGEMTYYENAWAGLISLILWCSGISNKCKITNISDAKPAGPVEEEIPPELPMTVIQNLNRSLLGPGTYPFYIEILNKEKQKIDRIKIQIRRENEYYLYQQYEFKPNIMKQGNTFIQVELPIGAGSYFFDIWLIQKEKVLDFFTKRFSFNSWPEISSVETNKKFVFPDDTITLKITIPPSIIENREGTIIAQGVDNYSYPTIAEKNIVCEQCQPIKGKGGEVTITLNFADILGNYLKINIWGAPIRISYLGTNYSNLFSYSSLFIPVQRKVFKRRGRDFIQLNHIREHNQMQVAKFFIDSFKYGSYLSIDNYELPNITKIYQPCIVQMTEETAPKATNKNIREPCINDENYLKKIKDTLIQTLNHYIIPTPYAISLGKNNCLTQTEEFVCLCENCVNKFLQFIQVNGYWDNTPELVKKFKHENIEIIKDEVVKKNSPAYLSFYKKFMENSFIYYETDLKNKLKTLFPDTPIGFRYFSDNGKISDIDWIETINNMDWIILEPEPFSYSLVPYIKSKNKSFWLSLDFTNPKQTPEEMLWNYWNSVLNQANGVLFLNINGDIYNSIPIKLFDEHWNITQELESIFNISKKLSGGLRDLLLQLEPDFSEEVGIYYSPENLFLTSPLPDYNYKNSFTYFTRLLNGFGINPIIITKENILNSKNKLKILVLPCCLWLSEEEILNITEFSDKGIIIADISPGTINNPDLIHDIQYILDNQSIYSEKVKNKNILLLNKNPSPNINSKPLDNIKKDISLIQNILKIKDIKNVYSNDYKWIDGKFYSYNNGEIIAWLPNLNPIGITKKIQLNLNSNKNKQLFDLIKEKRIRNPKKVLFDTSIMEPVILSCSKKSKLDLDIICPQSILRGNRIPIKLRVLAKENINTWIIIELKLDKRNNDTVYSEIVNIEGGKTKEVFIPVPNNLALGWYTIFIKEMKTGMMLEKHIKIE